MALRSCLAALLAFAATPAFAQPFTATPLGTYETGIFDEGAAEIVAFDANRNRAYFVNANANEVVALDVSDPSNPSFLGSRQLGEGETANSVAVFGDLIAVATAAEAPEAPGSVIFFGANGVRLATVPVGALPDAVAFTPDGRYVVVACEGEPASDGSVDPEGSVFVIDAATYAPYAVTFTAFNAGEARSSEVTSQPSIRIFSPGATVAQDLEPEFVTISDDGQTAYVTIQENNALAAIDIATAVASPGTSDAVTALVGLGFKDWSTSRLDASDRDDSRVRRAYPVFGIYQPDGADAFTVDGQTYIAVANEGDAREYDFFEEEERVKDLTLDPTAFSVPVEVLQRDEFLGRLTVTTTLGDTDNDGEYEELYTLGGRSFSIHDASGARIFDSGEGLEQAISAAITAGILPREAHNANNDDNDSFDSRSDNKGPEPEGVVIGEVEGTLYAFVGMERVSAIAVYDVTDPANAQYRALLINRDWDAPIESAGDLGPEGLAFVPAEDSPTGAAMLIVSNEVSGTVTFWDLTPVPAVPLSEPLAALAPEASAVEALETSLAPNPTRGPAVLVLELPAEAPVSARVYDALGREVAALPVQAVPAGRSRLALPTADLPAGAYVVRVRAGATVTTHRLTVAR